MSRYVRVSGVCFGLLALVQLTRALFRWPVQVDGVTIPVWASAVAFVIASSFTIWAVQTARAEPPGT